MKNQLYILLLLVFALSGCSDGKDVPIPTAGPNSIISQTYPINSTVAAQMEGVYDVEQGDGTFGEQVVLKFNRKGLLIACNDGKHFILQAGYLDSVIFLQGYWRNGYNDETGPATMAIGRNEGGRELMAGLAPSSLVIRGATGKNNGLPDEPMVLVKRRDFSQTVQLEHFMVLAHRGGGRSSDRLPVSENSLAMIGFTEQLGSTGIEVDVRLSKDGIPFLYHDNDLNIRLTQKGPLAGPAENYTMGQLKQFVTLLHGEKIPTLEEALVYTIDSTLLEFVYLDMKTGSGGVASVADIQKKMLDRAAFKGRTVMIVIGIPNDDVKSSLMALPGYTEIPSLCELGTEDVRQLNSAVWAPRWTLGTQNEQVAAMQSEGRLAVCWTIDQANWINEFITEGRFDGMLTNYPYVVTYYHYIR